MNATNLLKKVSQLLIQLSEIPQDISDIKQSLGRIEKRQLEKVNSMRIDHNEFKVSSQNGEDGIIQFLIRNIDIPNKIFVEFGVHRYVESNTRFLLQNDTWSGLVIDGSQKNIDYIKSDHIYWKNNLKAECAFISRANINDLISKNGLKGDIGLLSIDIDGNDYWVWEAIDCISPRIVICEYNGLYGSKAKVSIPYDEKFVYSQAHYSTLYWGASIGAFDFLAQQKGYSLIGSNTKGNNIFFVRNDVLGSLPTVNPQEGFVKSTFRTSRDQSGKLTFLDSETSMKLIAELPLCDVETNEIIRVQDLVKAL